LFCCIGGKYELYISSPTFIPLKTLDRHRLINNLVTAAGLMNSIHALSIKAWTPEEWEKRKDTITKI
jgi:stress-induced morphogen